MFVPVNDVGVIAAPARSRSFASGLGVRLDSAIYAGYSIPPNYDSLIGKLIVHAPTRAEAIARMKRALGEYHVGGIRTTIPFFLSVLEDPEFCQGDIDTGYIARFLARQNAIAAEDASQEELQTVAAIVAALDYTQTAKTSAQADTSTQPSASQWKQAGRMAALHRR